MPQVQIEGGRAEKMFLNDMRMLNETRTMAGTVVLSVKSPTLQFLDPGGSARNLDLPAEADSDGLVFVVANTADAAEIITIRNDAAGTICTPTQSETAIVFCNGVLWVGLVGASA